MPLRRGKMADDFVVATEKYGSGNLERKYRFSAESGNVERIGRQRETIATSVKQFFKVIYAMLAPSIAFFTSLHATLLVFRYTVLYIKFVADSRVIEC